MSILKFLFGAKTEDFKPKLLGEDDYKGFIISAIEKEAGSEYQLFGKIEKEVNGELKVMEFIRADKLPSVEEVRKFSLKKGRQIIDEQGEDLFNQHR